MRFFYNIEGMHCSSCVKKIKTSLSSQVKVIEVTLHPPRLQVEAEKPPSLDELNATLLLAGNYRLQSITHHTEKQPVSTPERKQEGLRAYYPIFLITFYIVVVASINNFHGSEINGQHWMNQFMAGFFLVFSAFKFLDIRGFAEGYATYDLLAQRWYTYGLIYPFLELSLGVLYVGGWLPMTTLLFTILLMGFSSLGVINSLLKKQKLQCACLGTLLNVPLSSVTLIEDLAMVGLAVLSLGHLLILS